MNIDGIRGQKQIFVSFSVEHTKCLAKSKEKRKKMCVQNSQTLDENSQMDEIV